MGKLYSVATGIFVATLMASAAHADGADISAQRLLSAWKGEDPNMRMVAEVCYSARGPHADWRASSLIRLVQAGSRNDADSQRTPVSGKRRSSTDGLANGPILPGVVLNGTAKFCLTKHHDPHPLLSCDRLLVIRRN
jgi:hypothetical protein